MHKAFIFTAHKCEKKLVILQSIGIIVIKSKETRVITYTCRYSSGPLIPNSATVTDWNIGINRPLEYLQVYATTIVSLLFIYVIPIACKITKIFLILVCLLFWKHHNFSCLIFACTVLQERIAGACLNNWLTEHW